jgi:putative ABC transport system permease protein
MISTDLKIAFRNIARNRVVSVISILGLGIGLGCIILLVALILHETSFNSYIPGNRNVYRVLFGNSGVTAYPLAEKMKEEIPGVADYFRFYQVNSIGLRNSDGQLVNGKNFGFADPSIFRISGVKLLSGGAANTVTEVSISESAAKKYFNKISPLGEILTVKFQDGFSDLTICGIYKDFPSNSTLFPDFIAHIKLSDEVLKRFQSQLGTYGNETNSSLNWSNNEFLTYVVLEKNADKSAVSQKMDSYKEILKKESESNSKYLLQPVTDIYLKSSGTNAASFWRQGNPNELKYYEAISIIILAISVVNFVLLSRAIQSERIRELGTRKVLGASRLSILKQIILESNIISIISLIPAFFIIDYGISSIDETLNKTLSSEIFYNSQMWFILITVIVFTGTVSGILIGYRISGVPAIGHLSGKESLKKKNFRWNYSFLVFHFSIYFLLVVSVLTVSKQIKYSMTGLKGIHPENILITNMNTPELKRGYIALCEEMAKIPGVNKVSGASFMPPMGAFLPINLANADGEKVRFDGMIMGEGMTELLGIEIKEGTSFGQYRPTPIDVLFNETAAKKYNIKAGDNYRGFNVKGIVQDFNAHSLHSLIQPVVILQQNPEKMGLLVIKTDGKNDEKIIKRLKELYSNLAPDEIFETRYLTDEISDFYGNEKNQSKIIGSFSILAMMLSIMGLFGIALISISKRTKEIGIRKVNGATIGEILILLNADFLKWVMAAIVISVPASVWLMSKWLDRFAYKTQMSIWIFLFAGLSAILIAVLTTSWQSWRAATGNPVEALRYE